MQKRLGRGLGSLIQPDPYPGAGEPQAEIELDRIRPNPFQPRRTFAEADLEELKTSILNHGVLQPVVVRPVPASPQGGVTDGFELVAGERRWRAARLAGLDRIPAVVKESLGDDAMLELALVENVQRQDLDPLEKARGYRALQDRLGLTQDQVASRVGLQRSTVTNHLRLLELPETVQEAVVNGLISMGHARALLGLSTAEEKVRLLEETVRARLSVREVEERVRRQGSRPRARQAPRVGEEDADTRAPWAVELERRLREGLGTKVDLTSDGNCRGKLSIEFYDREGLERLVERLAPQPRLP